jgi:hypothetical protein
MALANSVDRCAGYTTKQDVMVKRWRRSEGDSFPQVATCAFAGHWKKSTDDAPLFCQDLDATTF